MKFKINQICFDSENKEFVRITNGVEVSGEFVPTEALAIRFVCLNEGKPTLAFTYRQVKSSFLSETTHNSFEALLDSPKKPQYYSFIGRV